MAYSDYGGYAFLNGVRVEERSDFTISPDGAGFGTPGSWPGFAMIAAGASEAEVKERIQWPHHHVVLGDGPIFVGLHKQSSTLIYRLGENLCEVDLLVPESRDLVDTWKDEDGKVHRWVDSDKAITADRPAIFEVDGHRIEVRYTHQDNYYQYAKLTQPDGKVWYGWSGYGVGAGLEDCGYGYSTEERNETLASLWPEAFRATSEAPPQ